MSDNPNEDRSYILIEFDEQGSVMMNLHLQNVTPLQILAAASYLEFDGKSNLAVQRAAQMQYEMQKNQAQKLYVPGKEEIFLAE